MDLPMDIAVTMDELKRQQPIIGPLAHMRSWLRVGRTVTGTMITTLLLAYLGSHIAMFMIFLAKGLPAQNLLNAPFVAAEILNILVGSFGVVAVAACTVVFAALLYRLQTTKRADALIHEHPVIAGEPQNLEHCSAPYAPLSK